MTDILWSADVPNVQRETRLRLMEGSGTDGETTTVDVCLVCKNDGKTPAWITERKLWLKIFDEAPSARPDTTTPPSFTLGGPESLSVGEVSKVDAQLTCSGRRPQVGGALVMYGVVKYRDVFGKHETWCGYTVVGDPRNVRLQRLAEYPEYNKNT